MLGNSLKNPPEQEQSPGTLGRLRTFLFQNSSVRQTIAKNTFWLGVSNIASRSIKAILIIYIARLLGTAGYGLFSFAVSLAALFSIFSDIGISGILTREVSKHKEDAARYFSTGLAIKLILLLVSVSLVIFVAPFFTKIPEVLPLLPIAALLIAFDGLRDFTFSITRAREEMQIEAGINILTNFAITAFGIVAIFLNASPLMLLTGYAVGSGTGTLVAAIVYRRFFYKFWRSFDQTLIGKLIKEGWPLAIMGLLGVIMINTDTIMLGWFLSAEDIGLYSAALRPVQFLYFMPIILSISVFPILARLAQSEKDKFRKVFETVIASTFLLSVPLFVGGLLLSQEIIEFIFGVAFLPAAAAFSILIFTVIINFPSSFLSNGIFAYNKQKFFILAIGIGAVGNMILNFFLIPRYGIVGSAIATVITQLVAYGIMWYRMDTINHFTVLPYLPRIVVSTTVMGVLVWGLSYTNLHVLGVIAISGLAYAAMLFFLKEPLLRNLHPSKLLDV